MVCTGRRVLKLLDRSRRWAHSSAPMCARCHEYLPAMTARPAILPFVPRHFDHLFCIRLPIAVPNWTFCAPMQAGEDADDEKIVSASVVRGHRVGDGAAGGRGKVFVWYLVRVTCGASSGDAQPQR